MQMFNVQSKTDRKTLVYCANQTKKVNKKTKKKTTEQSKV